MHVIWWILLILAAVIGAVGVAFSLSSLLYLRKFARSSHVTLATVVGQKELKRKGMLPLVQFRTAKRKVTTTALVFEKTVAVTMGQKVSIRYLDNEKLTPDKWDVRIISKSGYGKERTTRLSAIVLAAAAAVLIAAVLVMILCG